MDLVKKLSELDKNQVALVGGKAASLGELLKAGLPVPNGFVVTTTAFELFLEQADLTERIKVILKHVDVGNGEAVQASSGEIADLILSASLPKELFNEINKALAGHSGKSFAVRSSATAEDNQNAAWAGQLDTYLNVPAEKVADRVQCCFASLYTPRAISYRVSQNFAEEKISVAVVVQEMVQSEKAGIAFSVHPVSQDENELIIEAGYGLGEAIVSGQVTPNSYVVKKNPKTVSSVTVSNQVKGLFRSSQGDNEWRDLGKKGSEQVLLEPAIFELSELIVKIEQYWGFPCDIEWAYADNKFYITQSRPITTLSSGSKDSPKVRDKFKLLFTAEGDLNPPFFAEKVAKAGYIKYGGVNTYQSGLSKTYILESAEKLYGLEIKDWYQDTALLQAYLGRAKKIAERATIFLEKDILHKTQLSSEEWKSFLLEHDEMFIELLSVYKYLEPHFTSGIEELIKTTGVQWSESVVLGDLKFDFRRLLHKLADFDNAWSTILSHQFKIEGQLVFALHLDELLKIVSGELKSEQLYPITARIENYAFVDPGEGETYFLEGDEAAEFIAVLERQTKYVTGTRFIGAVAYPGVVTAPVYKVPYATGIDDTLNKAINKFPEGSILLARSTGPELSSIFPKCVGIISEEGGITSHASVVAREYKKPTMLGIPGIYDALQDGQVVDLDAEAGIINVHE